MLIWMTRRVTLFPTIWGACRCHFTLFCSFLARQPFEWLVDRHFENFVFCLLDLTPPPKMVWYSFCLSLHIVALFRAATLNTAFRMRQTLKASNGFLHFSRKKHCRGIDFYWYAGGFEMLVFKSCMPQSDTKQLPHIAFSPTNTRKYYGYDH